MAGRCSLPVRALLAAKQHATLGSLELELRLVRPTGIFELLSISQNSDTSPPQSYTSVELLPPIVRASIAQSRSIYKSRVLAGPFQPTSPLLFPDINKRSKDTAPKPAAPVPKAEDCDTAIKEYDDLNSRLNQLERPASMRGVGEQVKDVVVAIGKGTMAVVRFTGSIPARIQSFNSMSKEEWKAKKSALWKNVKHEAHHYWVGFKVLAYEVRIASGYALKAARGEALTRRERKQLTRTTADLFRLVPLIVILVIPFLEFALPVLLRLFPNMLPSTFEDKLKKEEEMKRRLGIKLELAKFLQDTVSEMAKDLQRTGKGAQAVTAVELYEFIQRVRAGVAVENHEIIRFAQLFNDALTLDNLERVQLVSMAQFVGITPFGTDQYLRNKLRAHLQQIKHDDYEIEREGLENLTEDELRTACRARGMRAPFGEGAVAFMRRQLQDWLDLSLHRGLPSSLLLMSRAFTITASVKDVAAKKDVAYEKLKETLSVIPEEVVERVEFESLGGATGAKDGTKVLEKKLEFLKREEELIKEEAAAAKAAAKAAPPPAAKAAPAEPALSAAAAAAGVTPAGETSTAAAAQAMAAAAMGAALKNEVEAALTVESLSDEERAAKIAAAREARVSAILEALLSLASSSAVARERQLFMELVSTEMTRLNKSFAEKSGGTSSSMAFSSAGLSVSAAGGGDGGAGGEGGAAEADSGGSGAASKRLGARVAKMLKSIEQELDKVETSIGDKLQLLDTDRDGVVSKQELQAAVSFLKQQLDPADLELLFEKLGAAASDPNSPIKVDELQALAQVNRAAESQDESSSDPVKKEVVKIHTL